jgi:hypothetical protein
MNLAAAVADPSRTLTKGFFVMIRTTISRRAVALGLAAVMAAPAPLLARATEPPATAKRFVEGIYAKYVGAATQGSPGVVLENPSSIKRYFTPGLASLILDDEAAAHQRGEPPTLDGDAFVGHQDWNIADMSIDVKEIGAKAKATVNFVNFGKSETVVVELLKVGEDWRIADIAWDSGTLRGLFRKK